MAKTATGEFFGEHDPDDLSFRVIEVTATLHPQLVVEARLGTCACGIARATQHPPAVELLRKGETLRVWCKCGRMLVARVARIVAPAPVVVQ